MEPKKSNDQRSRRTKPQVRGPKRVPPVHTLVRREVPEGKLEPGRRTRPAQG